MLTVKNREEKVFRIIGNFIMVILSCGALIPIILLVISSFTSNRSLIQNGYSFFPKELSLEAYSYMFTSSNKITNAYGISFLVTILGTSGSIIITTMMAYPLSRKDLPFRGVFTFIVFFTMLFNGGLVPTYLNYTSVFNIKNTIWALLIPSLLMNAYNVMLMKSFYATNIPFEIIEAAHIDGAGEFRTFIGIVIPMAKPIIAAVGIFVGIAYWNDWNNGFIYLTTRTDLYSIQNLLNRMIQNIQFLSQNVSNLSQAGEGLAKIPAVSIRMSMAVMGILPIIIAYPFIQNSFVKGITLGGVKG
jgi:putative aldouronate transport system permease protein